jgi:CPA2 family monovalent cation:H+ antiporter-2
MDEIVLLTSLALFLLLAAVCSIVFNKIKLPPLIGYLIAGIIISNTIVISEDSQDVVEMLSDMGLIMLMFCIGLEINLKKIRKQGLFAMKVAVVEIPFMVLGGTVLGILIGLDPIQSICLGAVMAGSSTAVVLGVLKMQKRLDKDSIDTLILVIIMEDIAQVVILSMLTPLMAGNELETGKLIAMIASIVALMVASLIVGVRLMPRLINWVSDNVSSEVLVVLTVGLAFGMSLLANYVGLSVAIGAFLMGMMIASSRKSKEVLLSIEPMKNIFMAMFFISVGMEISLVTLSNNISLTLILLLAFVGMKCLAVFSGYWLANESARKSFASAISFVAMGEFAFIISKQALDYGVFSEATYTSIVGAALLSMILLPFLSKNAVRNWDFISERLPDPLIDVFKNISKAKDSFYSGIQNSSNRARKEVSSAMTLSYVCILLVAVIEIVFIIASPYIRDWAVTYFHGPPTFWSGVILLLNLFALYIPIYSLTENLRNMYEISRRHQWGSNKERTVRHGMVDSIFMSNSMMLALMIDITILIIIPNDLGIWEHFIILFIALVILVMINRRSIKRKSEIASYDLSEDESEEMTTASFKELIDKKMQTAEDSDTPVPVNMDDKQC